MRANRLWVWFRDIPNLLQLLLLLPPAIGLIVGGIAYVTRSPADAVVMGVVVWAITQPVLAAILFAARVAANRVLDIEIEPTSGPSPEIRLNIVNHSAKASFRAKARILVQRNDPNPQRGGVYSLPWVDTVDAAMMLDKSQHGALLVARFVGANMRTDSKPMGEAQLVEWTAGSRSTWSTWSGFRWFYAPTQLLPEFDLEVTLVTDRAASATRQFTLRPAGFAGPLELLPVDVARLKPLPPPKPVPLIKRPYEMLKADEARAAKADAERTKPLPDDTLGQPFARPRPTSTKERSAVLEEGERLQVELLKVLRESQRSHSLLGTWPLIGEIGDRIEKWHSRAVKVIDASQNLTLVQKAAAPAFRNSALTRSLGGHSAEDLAKILDGTLALLRKDLIP